jgi:uncharacterized membrane protein HdeD (DUF308 family)
MSTEKEMNPEESLAIIHAMINKARFNFSRGSFYFITWGILLFIAAIFEYVAQQSEMELFYLGWPIAGLVGGIASAVYGSKSRANGPNTHLDKIYSAIWITYFFTLILFIIGMGLNRINPGPYIMLITGLPTFLTGYILEFKPLQVGGVLFWLAGLLSLIFPTEFGSLIFGVVMLGGYLVPGIIMRQMKENV